MRVIMDTGPWVALVDRSESRHKECVEWLKKFEGEIFTSEAVSLICKHSGGVPRTINIICDNALLIGYSLSKKKINAYIINEVLRDMDGLIYVPDEQAFSSQTDVAGSGLIGPWVDMAFELSVRGEYEKAMTLNGFLYCGALGFGTEPMLMALEAGIAGVSLSGTGPAYTALAAGGKADRLVEVWSALDGRVIRTKVNNNGARTGK